MSNGATVSRNLVDKFQTEGLSARSRAACLPRPSLDAICNRMDEFSAAKLANLPPEAA
jgi:hypothetical protein